jgi:pyruvate formate lyase activating enzyme
MKTLAEELAQQTRLAELYEPLENERVRCVACGHRCPIGEGLPGVCKVRFNRGGKLYAPYGYAAGIACDPIEKKPFYHVLPGARALSFGMLGCDLHCGYCQNWVTSQSLRDPAASVRFQHVEPQQIAEMALTYGAQCVVSTYNEPLITAEWAVDVFRHAKAEGLLTGFVSNGNATPEVLEYLRPWLDLYKVDLKSFQDRHYRQLGGRLQPVLDSIRSIHRMGFWLEVLTLVVPGFNDSDEELESIAGFLVSISPDIPWHITAFHPDYKMLDPQATPAATLARAASIGTRAGLRYVYAGNLPSQVGHYEHTGCPGCGEILIRRVGFRVLQNRVSQQGRCPTCGAAIPGIWRLPDRCANRDPEPLISAARH